MPAAKVFFDTNVIIYTRDNADDPRIALARAWFAAAEERKCLIVNLQVLNELASVLLRKHRGIATDDVFATIDRLGVFGDSPVTMSTVGLARQVRRQTAYSWWDCVLLASALELGCSHFLSEDLQDGQKIGAMTIINPFIHPPETVLPQDVRQ